MSASCTKKIFSHKQRVDQERMQYSHGKNVLQAHHFMFNIFYKYFNDCKCKGLSHIFLYERKNLHWPPLVFTQKKKKKMDRTDFFNSHKDAQ